MSNATAERPAPAAARVASPMTVEVPQRDRAAAPTTKEYWIGLLGDCPRQDYAIAGVDFHKWTGVCNYDEAGNPDRERTVGERRHLSNDQIERIKDEIKYAVVRTRTAPDPKNPAGGIERRDVLSTRGADPEFAPHGPDGRPVLTYREPAAHEEPDVPFGCFVFMYAVEPGVMLPTNPQPMVARPKA